MIEIRDQQLRLLVLAHLIRELQRSAEENRPAPPGLSGAQFAELRTLSTDDLVRLSEMQEPRVAVQIDAGSFEHGLRQVGYIGKRSKQIEHFIRHGATSAMLTRLFRISSTDVTLKRRLFAGTHEKLRRPAMPPPAVREAIQKRWWEIRKGKEREPLRPEEYEALHADYPTLTYATLWAVVHEFGD
ncbi:MAG TPA: STY4526/YPO1902 family pathogenicity island replication protein [Usitatibacteraceae bacterium]|nr:STY4526/YPO1902 family pathogenicity island replication protein [Usitatibacteraceae bacterium]